MNAEFRIAFDSPADARRAARIVRGKVTGRAGVALSAEGGILVARVRASDFTALRAKSTSFLREVSVVLASLQAVKNARAQSP